MAIGQNRIIHRFIRPISDYEEGGVYYNQVIPIDTQAYAYYPPERERDFELYYVFGDGIHTYVEIRDGKSVSDTVEEYPVLNEDWIQRIKHIHSFEIEIVDTLPYPGVDHTLYLVVKDNDDPTKKFPVDKNYYDEYLWINNKYEYIGCTGDFVEHSELVAENIKYTNSKYSTMSNSKQALDLVLDRTKTYVHSQGEASAEWIIEHNMDNYPSVTVVNSAEEVVIGNITYITANKIKIEFKSAFKGKAFLN